MSTKARNVKTTLTLELDARQLQRLGYYTRASGKSGAEAIGQALRLLFKRHPKKSRKPVAAPDKEPYEPRKHNAVMIVCEERTTSYANTLRDNIVQDFGVSQRQVYVNAGMPGGDGLKRLIKHYMLTSVRSDATLGLFVETTNASMRVAVDSLVRELGLDYTSRIRVIYYGNRYVLLKSLGQILDGKTTGRRL